MLENMTPVKAIRSCKVRTLKEDLELSDQKLLDGYLADVQNWTPHKLAKALGLKGLKIDHRQISQHRDGMCSCSDILS
jgi:hypothetical protein